MNLDSIDAKLNEWKSDSAKLHTNLLELSSLYGYKLAGDGSALTGITKAQYQQAVEKEAQLWKDTELFSDLLKRIAEKRKALGPRPRSSALDEVTDLFEGNSIELPGEEVALPKRDVFSEKRHVETISAREIRERMRSDFHSVCDFYDNLETTWRSLDESVSAVRREADEIFAEASNFVAIGQSGSNALTVLSEKLQVFNNSWRCDPLGMTGDVRREFLPCLRDARAYTASLTSEFAEIVAAVKQTSGKSSELAAKEKRALELHADCLSRFLFSSENGPQLPPSSKSLAEQSNRLIVLLNEKKWVELRTALKSWTDEYNRISRATEHALSTNEELVSKRTVLRQRFFETIAKCQAYAAEGMAIPRSVETFTERGQVLLKGSDGKVDLEALERIVLALEVKVSELCLKFDG